MSLFQRGGILIQTLDLSSTSSEAGKEEILMVAQREGAKPPTYCSFKALSDNN